LQEITIRGQEVKVEAPQQPKFTAKVATMKIEVEKKKQEEEEFHDIMNKVKTGQFLHSVGRDLTK
jgi:hypothetical protein